MSITQENYEQGIRLFDRRRTDEDVNLTDYVRQLLIKNGISDAALFIYDTNDYIIASRSRAPDAQRFFQNKFWNNQLLMCEVASVDVRVHLLPNGSIENWINTFNERVIPFIIQNNLPKQYQ